MNTTVTSSSEQFMQLANGGLHVGLCVEPLDPLFFRDGRPFGAAGFGRGGLPLPQTVAGAIRTLLLRHINPDALSGFDRLCGDQAKQHLFIASILSAVRCQGPWLAHMRADGVLDDILVPVPADVVTKGKDRNAELVRMHIATKMVPGWQPPEEDMKPLWLQIDHETSACNGYLNQKGLKTYLSGGCPSRQDVVDAEKILEFESRCGVGINPDCQVAEDRLLYSLRLLRLKPGFVFYVEAKLNLGALGIERQAVENLLSGPGVAHSFGGEGRMASFRAVSRPWVWPSGASGLRKACLLITPSPMQYEPYWRPRTPSGLKLVAAAVPGYQSVSGWDLANRRPKPTRHLVPAGSVYYYEGDSDLSLDDLCADQDAAIGYGVILKGTWQ